MAANLIQRLSGGAANVAPASALGGAISAQAGAILTDNVANNLWRNITAAEAAAGLVIFRCWYVENTGDQTANNVVLFVDDEGVGVSGSNIDVALDSAAIGANSATTIANEAAVPGTAGAFSRPATAGAGIAVGSIPAGSKKAVWERLTITAGALAGTDIPSVTVQGDSLP